MKKLTLMLFVSSFLLTFSQTWNSNYPDNVFKDSYRSPYDNQYDYHDSEQQLYQKKEREIVQEAEYVRIILNGTKNIFIQAEQDRSAARPSDESAGNSPGAPGEPVPVDNNIFILLFTALIIMIIQKRNDLKIF